MGLFYPDNDKRKERAISLATQTSDGLSQVTANLMDFKAGIADANQKIKDAFNSVDLPKPNTTTVDINRIKDSVDFSSDETIIEVIEIIADVSGFISSTKWLFPGLVKFLKGGTRIMSAETAAKTMVYYVNREGEQVVVLDVGDFLGGILSGVISGAIVAGVDLVIEGIEEAEQKSAYIDAIKKGFKARTEIEIVRQKSEQLKLLVHALNITYGANVSALTDALGGDKELIKKALNELAKKDVKQIMDAIKSVDKDKVLASLKEKDKVDSEYTSDDPD